MAPTDVELSSKQEGFIEYAGNWQVSGWVWNKSDPSARQRIVVKLDGLEIGEAVANEYRKDLADAGVGDGKHAFIVKLQWQVRDDALSSLRVFVKDSKKAIPLAAGAVCAGSRTPAVHNRAIRQLTQFFKAQVGVRRLLAADQELTSAERRVLEQMNKTICLEEVCFRTSAGIYFGAGLSALRNINEAVAACKAPDTIRSILDFPCGHGRVLRMLAKQFPKAEITASDIDPQGVSFCVKTFGAKGVLSDVDFTKIDFKRKFDLIWCGSLTTHLEAAKTEELLDCFGRHLNPGGLLLFTTHGDFAVGNMEKDFDSCYGITKEDSQQIRQSYDETGHGYVLYPGRTDYGIAAYSPDWIQKYFDKKSGWKRVYFKAHGWDAHQDVLGYSRPD